MDTEMDTEVDSYSRRVGARLREVRLAAGLSLFDVECASGRRIKASILGSYERCERVINVDRLAVLAEFYGVEVAELLPSSSNPPHSM